MNQSPWANYHSLNMKHNIKLTPYSDESRTSTLKHACCASENDPRVHHLVSGTTPSRSLDQRVYQDFLFKLYTLTVNEIYDEYPKINALAELTRLR